MSALFAEIIVIATGAVTQQSSRMAADAVPTLPMTTRFDR